VTDVRLSDDGKRVTEIDVVRQAKLKHPSKEYEPLYDVKVDGGGTLPCWPSEPDWDQLDPDTERRNFEDESAIEGDKRTLALGDDFDHVVLGISLGSLRGICGDLIAKNKTFATAIDKGVTVRTQAFQLWMNRTAEELGWEYEHESVAGAYVEPIDTYCEMSHLMPVEHWAGTKSIAYFCAVQKHIEGEDQEAATARAKQDALEFLNQDVGPLWPRAVTGGGGGPLDWSLLVDPGDGHTGEKRFDAQYWRANIAGSELYVLTPAGTVTARVSPAGFGVDNLVPVGDWTRTGVDGGCVEAAAISGVRAAHTLIGDHHEIPGEDPRWLRQR
jgi:uncharacterized protein with NAD-binding domain and iron-sulfur cluster